MNSLNKVECRAMNLPALRRRRNFAAGRRLAASLALATVLLAAATSSTAAGAWPSRPILLTVIGAPGSAPDVVGRELGDRVGIALGQPVVIENLGGGGGIVGMEQVRRAPPDGYRFVLSHLTVLAVNPALFPSLPYDPVNDYEPVSLLFSGPMILVARPGLGVTTFDQLVSLAKAKPGSLFYGSTGIAGPSSIFFEQLKAAARLAIDQVPFKGPGGLMMALQTDQVPMGMEGYQSVGPLITSGKLRALAVSGDTRLAVLPDVPTFKELGVPGMGVSWLAVLAPKSTPAPIIVTMQRELARALTTAPLRQSYTALGRQIIASTPDELAIRLREELLHWRDVIRRTGITVQ